MDFKFVVKFLNPNKGSFQLASVVEEPNFLFLSTSLATGLHGTFTLTQV